MNKDKESLINSKKLLNVYALVVLLDYADKYSLAEDISQPAYFRVELGIDDEVAFIRKAEKQKYIKKDNNGTFELTVKGEKFLEKYGDYLEFFNIATPYVNILEYENEKKNAGTNSTFEVTMITLLLKKIKQLEAKDDYEGVKNLHYDIGRLYEKIDYKGQAMYHYLVSLYFEVSGLNYYDKFLGYMTKKCSRKELESSYNYVYIDPNITKAINGLGQVYYGDMAEAVYEKNKISVNLCSKSKFEDLVNEIISGNFNLDNWQGRFKAAFNGALKAMEKKSFKLYSY